MEYQIELVAATSKFCGHRAFIILQITMGSVKNIDKYKVKVKKIML